MKLYNFCRSSASFRVRIAANLKGISYEYMPINLGRGESHTPDYEALNPQGVVPTLEDNGKIFTQSLAICEYFEETHPNPSILPRDPAQRAHARAIALAVACEIHPLAGRGANYLGSALKATEEQRKQWTDHWFNTGFKAIETMLTNWKETGRFCVGDQLTVADIFLVPHVYNGERAGIDTKAFPTIKRIYDECLKVDAVDRARPERQPDFPK